jgi:hypothetical protein
MRVSSLHFRPLGILKDTQAEGNTQLHYQPAIRKVLEGTVTENGQPSSAPGARVPMRTSATSLALQRAPKHARRTENRPALVQCEADPLTA